MLTVKQPENPGDMVQWGELYGSAASLALSQAIANANNQLFVIITPDSLSAQRLEHELRFFLENYEQHPILHFPDWETLPYDHFSPHQDIASERLSTLSRLSSLQHGILLLPVNSILHRLPPHTFIDAHSFVLDCGQRINSEKLRQRLQRCGYHCVSQVMEHGEFAMRGSIIDIFPMGAEQPFRLDLFDDEIETIRLFDVDDQLSTEKVTSIHLLPGCEYPFTPEAISLFRQQWRESFSGNPMQCPMYQDISEGLSSAGIEYYLPLFFTEMANLFSYLPSNSTVVQVGDIDAAIQQFQQQYQHRYEQLQYNIERPILAPEKIFLSAHEYTDALRHYARINIKHGKINDKANRINYATANIPTLTIEHRAAEPLHKFIEYKEQNSQLRILFCTESAGRREALLVLLNKANHHPRNYDSWHEFMANTEKLGIIIGSLEQGLYLPEQNILVLTEDALFGEQVLQRRRRSKHKQKAYDPDSMIRNLAELEIGSPIVHIEHGVGRYLGLQIISLGDISREFLSLEYANDDKLYVPVTDLHLIGRYSGSDPENAPLHRLGSEQWQKAKRKAAEKIRDVAAELLEIYAKRAAQKGIKHELPEEAYQNFASSFPFEETPDQEQAINAVIDDMQTTNKMDRLVCGDVGFGKTEVAMRAAFVAVYNNKQVGILVPTTLLAQQHYDNFCDRFADWPVRIALLSRFKTKKEQLQVLDDLNNNKVDIVIGTHRLLQKDIKFHNIGLLIVDEEHRFGVRHKDQIKAIQADVDLLTLTATPIPRTLNMAFSGIRELSIIATPPARRLAIKTFVQQRQDHIIVEALQRELQRGGQVYFLHNNVATIEKTADEISRLIPEARVTFAHGQMRERELEHVMADFYHNRFNVLVCTTIVESGIDVPTANTIIIDRADKLGLAQLHQLRGRVGRSHHQAYAYLLIPGPKSISKDATKRLEAISSLEDLGAGFTLASHDLEIRGAGELLGDEQSGHMQAIGFDLYMDLLDRAVKTLKKGEKLDLELTNSSNAGIEIDLQMTALIPDDYLGDVHQRLILYKRIANLKSVAELDELQVEMIDRFGLLPQAIQNLFAISEVKIQATSLGICKIEASSKGGKITFVDKPNVDPVALIQLIQSKPREFKLSGNNQLRFLHISDNADIRINIVKDVVKLLSKLALPI